MRRVCARMPLQYRDPGEGASCDPQRSPAQAAVVRTTKLKRHRSKSHSRSSRGRPSVLATKRATSRCSSLPLSGPPKDTGTVGQNLVLHGSDRCLTVYPQQTKRMLRRGTPQDGRLYDEHQARGQGEHDEAGEVQVRTPRAASLTSERPRALRPDRIVSESDWSRIVTSPVGLASTDGRAAGQRGRCLRHSRGISAARQSALGQSVPPVSTRRSVSGKCG